MSSLAPSAQRAPRGASALPVAPPSRRAKLLGSRTWAARATAAALLCTGLCLPTAPAHARSAKRLKSEHFVASFQRVYRTKDGHERPPPLSPAQRLVASAWELRAPVGQLALSALPEWPSTAYLTAQFQRVRDVRFLDDGTTSPRRITWLYPDDGCYARAELVRAKLTDFAKEAAAVKAPPPRKIFVFGNLQARTRNAPGGLVRWWYHVAPVVRVGQEAYVLDPSIDASAPMPLRRWLAAVEGVQSAALCDEAAFEAHGPRCVGGRGDNRANAVYLEKSLYLPAERDRLQQLRRNAQKELGDRPPWSGRGR